MSPAPSLAKTLPGAILETIVTRLAALFLAGAAGDMTAARQAAAQMLSAYHSETEVEQVDLVKIDVEGTELDIIETTEPDIFQRCTQIAVEFHRFLNPSHASRIEKAVALMSGFGFRHIDFSNTKYHSHSDEPTHEPFGMGRIVDSKGKASSMTRTVKSIAQPNLQSGLSPDMPMSGRE
jgi:hypothetical protein